MNKNNKDSSMEEKSDLEKFLKSESLQKTDKKENNWGQLNEKLSSALQTWEDLSASVETKLSPDEEQLQEIKKLLKDLQTRIDEFRWALKNLQNHDKDSPLSSDWSLEEKILN